jgi:hypothetical protein
MNRKTAARPHDEETIARLLRDIQATASNRSAVLEAAGVPLRTYHRWVRRFGKLNGDTIRHIVRLENERANMERRVRQLEREMELLREVVGKPWRRRPPGGPPSVTP